MTEFENASLIIASIGAAAAIVNAIAVTVAAFGIWRGIGAMDRANKEHADQRREDSKQRREDLEQQREADERRHAETMQVLDGQRRALEALIEAGQRQHDASMTALNGLLRRSAPEPTA